MNDASNTSAIFIGAAILAFTGLYFLASGLTSGAWIMESLAVAMVALGVFLRKKLKALK